MAALAAGRIGRTPWAPGAGISRQTVSPALHVRIQVGKTTARNVALAAYTSTATVETSTSAYDGIKLDADAFAVTATAEPSLKTAGHSLVRLYTCVRCGYGDVLKVVGNAKQLGAWNADGAPKMTWSEGDLWNLAVELPAGEIQFKTVLQRADGSVTWESGSNRIVNVPATLTGTRAKGPGAAAAAAASEGGEHFVVRATAEPAARVGQRSLVRLRIQHTCGFGEVLKVCGSAKELGSWDGGKAPMMKWTMGDTWSLTTELPAGELQFKILVQHADGGLSWEDGANRIIDVPATLEGGKLLTGQKSADKAKSGDKKDAKTDKPEAKAPAKAETKADKAKEDKAKVVAAWAKPTDKKDTDKKDSSDKKSSDKESSDKKGGKAPSREEAGDPFGLVASASPAKAPGKKALVRLTAKKRCAFGSVLKVVGDSKDLGSWDASKAPAMKWSEGDNWKFEKELCTGELEFKMVTQHADGSVEWESGSNRVISVPSTGGDGKLLKAR